MSNLIRTILFFLLSTPLFGQQLDTTQVFTLNSYLQWVRAYHPVFKQAGLLEEKAEANLLETRGLFDPKLYGMYDDKSFDQKNYFRIGEAGLKVPTWLGIDVKVAYLWSSGYFLNPESTLPSNGQAIVGVDVSLLQGLLFDQRRAQVEQARLFREANEATRKSMINDLLLQAIEAYWEWAYQYQIVRIYETSLTLAQDRFQVARESFRQGDTPAIDTLESLILVQDRRQQLSQERAALQNSVLQLSNFLWYEDMVPLEVSPQLRPEGITTGVALEMAKVAPSFFENIKQTHPDLQALLVKQKQLDIKEKLKREQFKPQLKFNYYLLGNGFDLSADLPNASPIENIFTENYKWGLQFSYPLLLRKERGGLQLVRLEQLETAYKLETKALELNNKINSILQLLETTLEQLNSQQEIVNNYEALLLAENEKFRIGESSIFLLNNREQKLIEAQMKLLKLQTSFQKLNWKLDWAKGELR